MARIALPIDGNSNVFQGLPAAVALEETYDATVSATTEITLNAATTMIVVTAIDKAIFLKWGTSDASSTDWDVCLPANSLNAFYVPPDITAVNFIEEVATAKLAVSEF